MRRLRPLAFSVAIVGRIPSALLWCPVPATHKLDLYDADTAAQRLTVRLGKAQRDRVVPLTETAAHWLTRYVTVARTELAGGKLWGKGNAVANRN